MSAYKRNAANRRLILLLTSIWIVVTYGKEVRLETRYLTKQIQPWVMRGIIIIIIITITITIMKTITIMIMINTLFKLYIQIYQQHDALLFQRFIDLLLNQSRIFVFQLENTQLKYKSTIDLRLFCKVINSSWCSLLLMIDFGQGRYLLLLKSSSYTQYIAFNI